MDAKFYIDKYLGKKFGEGSSGCFLFVKHFYQEEFGIDLVNDYLEMLTVFREIKKVPEFGDIVVIRNHPMIPNHIGVYLAGGEFLHGGATLDHDEVILSRTDDPLHGKRIMGFLRHPGVVFTKW